MPTTKLIRANCFKRMRSMEPYSIDTIITDPPYGLKFMGKAWDHGSPGPAFWRAALRVAKPGAFLLCFGGTRTFHRLAVSIEDSGWEIRDCLMWLYGTGFPKSLNISKAIDKAAGAKRRIVGSKIGRPGYSLKANDTKNHNRKSYSKFTDAEKECEITTPSTKSAKEWDGYGTALKPAWEPIIVAMKPLDGTFAENAQRHRVAGLNIDMCRVETDRRPLRVAENRGLNRSTYEGGASKQGGSKAVGETSQGRWPANLVLDKAAGAMLDEQSGERPSGATRPYKQKHNASSYSVTSGMATHTKPADSGGAARFFYCAKASKSERGKGNNHPTVKPLKLMEYLCLLTRTPKGGIVLDPFMGSGTTGIACRNTKRSFIGIEKRREYFKIAKHRIRGK